MMPKSLDSLRKAYLVGRAMSNDGTYFASCPEITIDAAVLPKIEGEVLKNLPSQSLLTTTQVDEYQLDQDGPFQSGYNYLRRAFSAWTDKARGLMSNLNYEIVPFLTTSSAGKSSGVTSETLILQDKKIATARKKRIVAFAMDYHQLMSHAGFTRELSEPVQVVERTQIARRARAVAGVNNARILASLPFLRAGEILQKLLYHASSGKQKGNMYDIIELLYWTSALNVLCASSDVVGFDASTQMVSQTHFIAMISQVLGKIVQGDLLCYTAHELSRELNDQPLVLSALQMLAADVLSLLQPQATMVKGSVIPNVHTADPTFPSGLGFTTVHHTIRLISAICGRIIKSLEQRTLTSNLHMLRIQGDDVSMGFYGSISKNERSLQDAIKGIEDVGFKVENKMSVGTMEFLQQRVIMGTPVLYADRVSLLTAEKPKESKGPIEKMSELLALRMLAGK